MKAVSVVTIAGRTVVTRDLDTAMRIVVRHMSDHGWKALDETVRAGTDPDGDWWTRLYVDPHGVPHAVIVMRREVMA